MPSAHGSACVQVTASAFLQQQDSTYCHMREQCYAADPNMGCDKSTHVQKRSMHSSDGAFTSDTQGSSLSSSEKLRL